MEMEVTTRVINPIVANPSEMLLITCCLSSPFYDTIASQVMSKLSRFYAPSITQASEHLDDVDDLFGGICSNMTLFVQILFDPRSQNRPDV